jgi:hypothetical protein
MNIVIYNTATGGIRSIESRCETTTDQELIDYLAEISLDIGESFSYVESANTIDYVENYIDTSTKEIKSKEKFTGSWDKTAILANDVDEAVLSGLPLNTPLSVDGELIIVDDGSFEFSTADAGYYKIVFDIPQYYPETWEIIANEAQRKKEKQK